jgi:hypothetical protein
VLARKVTAAEPGQAIARIVRCNPRTSTRRHRRDHLPCRSAAQLHPELAKEYVQLRGAELSAELQISNAVDRQRFVAGVRERLAFDFERGSGASPVYLKDQRYRAVPSAEREVDRSRS